MSRDLECRHLAANCYIKQGSFDEALSVLGDKTPTHLISASKGRHKLARVDRHGTYRDRFDDSENGDRPEVSAEIRYQAAICYLRGVCYAKANAFDRAKECYKDAVRIDVQCFEAFDQLMKNALMTPAEEWEFLNSLNFDSIVTDGTNSTSQQAADLTKMLYTTRLSKYMNPKAFTTAVETLSTHYKLSSNADLMLSRAELLFTQCKFREALALTETILEDDRYNFSTLPVHLACLHELNEKNALFLLSHDFADHHPEEPATWLAVGVYYLAIGKIAEARRFFSKSSMMDPHFGPAWIGFAHTFAAEGEHDQAISAYSTAARLFQGTHLPQLFLGMQNLALQNLVLANEYLTGAYQVCPSDPLVLNELGVCLYDMDDTAKAIEAFLSALAIAQDLGADPRTLIVTRANLGHAYRRDGKLQEALHEFNEVLRNGGRDAGVFCAKGLILMELCEPWEAIVTLHEALAVNAQDPIANDLLGKALEESATEGVQGDYAADEDFEVAMESRKAHAEMKYRRRGRAKGSGLQYEVGGNGGDRMDVGGDE